MRLLPILVVLCFFGLIFGSVSLNKYLICNEREDDDDLIEEEKEDGGLNPFLNWERRWALTQRKISTTKSTAAQKKSLIALFFTSNVSFFDPEIETGRNPCRWLKGMRHQRKLCQRKKGLPEILLQTRKLAIKSCQLQFQFEQWNCSTIHMRKFFKKMYRETAFMYSLATSAFMYAVAQACIDGKLANCKCASHAKSENPAEWEGCSVNTRFAATFVEKFLQLKKKGDNPNNVMKYNSQVGLRVLRNKTKKICRCHGLSGACTHKICWRRLKPFAEVAEKLKQLYHTAIQVEPNNDVHDAREYKSKKQLVFLDASPNVCDAHRNGGISTVGRQCKDVDNCATLCCSNDYSTSTKTVYENCKCYWRNDTAYQLKCEVCPKEQIVYYCK